MEERNKFDRRDEWRDGSEPSDTTDHDATVNLSELQADDALLDALGGADSQMSTALSNNALNSLLLAWRRETDVEPLAELIDVDHAVDVITEAREASARRRHRRLLGPVAVAAAVLLIAFGGMSMAARDAHPGDMLWGLSQVLYADHARSVAAAAAVRSDFDAVRSAIAAGRIADARAALAKAQQSIAVVQGEDGQADLQATSQTLLDQLNGVDPSSATSGPASGMLNSTSNSGSSSSSALIPLPATSASSPAPDLITVQPSPTGSSSAPSATSDPSSAPNHSSTGSGTSDQSTSSSGTP